MKSIEIAVMAGQSITTIPTKSATKAGTVLAAVEVRRKAKRNSFHENRKTTMDTVIMAGLLMGGKVFLRGGELKKASVISGPSGFFWSPPNKPPRKHLGDDKFK